MKLIPTEVIWSDGKLVPWDEAKVHVLSHTLHYGGGVFEGLRAYKTPKGPGLVRLRDHMKRMIDSFASSAWTCPTTSRRCATR